MVNIFKFIISAINAISVIKVVIIIRNFFKSLRPCCYKRMNRFRDVEKAAVIFLLTGLNLHQYSSAP